jgi:hypothetical protein
MLYHGIEKMRCFISPVSVQLSQDINQEVKSQNSLLDGMVCHLCCGCRQLLWQCRYFFF